MRPSCKTLGDYCDLYVKTDAVLLADVFENFRKVCMEEYGLDPAHYYTAPDLSWDALVKKTGVELDLLTDLDMHLFIEKGLWGGISMASKRYSTANNPRAGDNNLYGWAMSLALPKRGFKWKKVMPTQQKIMKLKENSKVGWILEVSGRAPRNPEQLPARAREKGDRRQADVGIPKKNDGRSRAGLPEKRENGAHAGGQKQLRRPSQEPAILPRQGMCLTKVHRVIEFDQELWMEPYIPMNTDARHTIFGNDLAGIHMHKKLAEFHTQA